MTTKCVLPKLVLIEWADANTVSGPGWMQIDEIVKRGSAAVSDYNVSVGFVIHEDKRTITLVSNLSGITNFGDETDASGDVTIPKSWVMHRVNLPYTLRPRI